MNSKSEDVHVSEAVTHSRCSKLLDGLLDGVCSLADNPNILGAARRCRAYPGQTVHDGEHDPSREARGNALVGLVLVERRK